MYQMRVWSSDEMALTEENQSTQRKAYSSVTLTKTNPKWSGLGLNLSLHSDRMASPDPWQGLKKFFRETQIETFWNNLKWNMLRLLLIH